MRSHGEVCSEGELVDTYEEYELSQELEYLSKLFADLFLCSSNFFSMSIAENITLILLKIFKKRESYLFV